MGESRTHTPDFSAGQSPLAGSAVLLLPFSYSDGVGWRCIEGVNIGIMHPLQMRIRAKMLDQQLKTVRVSECHHQVLERAFTLLSTQHSDQF